MSVISITSLADLIESVPHLIGFHPQDSVVAVCLSGNRVRLTFRLDALTTEDPDESLLPLLRPVWSARADSVIVLGYGQKDNETVTREGAGRLAAFLAVHAGVETEVAVIVEGRWSHITCECCPPEGVPVSSGSAAALTLRVEGGAVPAASRAERAQCVAETSRAAGLLRVCEEAELAGVEDEAALAAWAVVVASEVPVAALGDEVLVTCAVALMRDKGLRDLLLALLCPGTLPLEVLPPERVERARRAIPLPWLPSRIDPGTRTRVLSRLSEVCAALPGVYAVEPLTVLGVLAWWCGDGVVANVALDRALRTDPTSRLAQLVTHAVGMGLPFPGRE